MEMMIWVMITNGIVIFIHIIASIPITTVILTAIIMMPLFVGAIIVIIYFSIIVVIISIINKSFRSYLSL